MWSSPNTVLVIKQVLSRCHLLIVIKLHLCNADDLGFRRQNESWLHQVLKSFRMEKAYQASQGSWLIGQTKVKWKKDFTGYLRISSLLFIFSLFLA